jgi:hypothetical protein
MMPIREAGGHPREIEAQADPVVLDVDGAAEAEPDHGAAFESARARYAEPEPVGGRSEPAVDRSVASALPGRVAILEGFACLGRMTDGGQEGGLPSEIERGAPRVPMPPRRRTQLDAEPLRRASAVLRACRVCQGVDPRTPRIALPEKGSGHMELFRRTERRANRRWTVGKPCTRSPCRWSCRWRVAVKPREQSGAVKPDVRTTGRNAREASTVF